MTIPILPIEPLTRAELQAAAGDALSLAAAGSQRATLDRLRQELAGAGEGESLVDDEGRLVVMSVLRGTTKLVTPAAIERMAADRVYFVRSNICNAVAVRLGDRAPAVVMFTGLLKALQYFMEIRGCISTLSAALDRDTDIGLTRRELSVASFQAMMGLCHFVAEDLPLERPGAALSVAAKTNLAFTFSQAIWFLLMHETGHVQLHHFDRQPNGEARAPPTLILSEVLNRHKLQEFEADRFYLESVNAEGRLYAFNYILDTLSIFSFIENHVGADRATHPLAVNRLQHIVSLYGSPEDTFFLQRTQSIIESELAARQSADQLRRGAASRGRAGLDVFASHAESQAAVWRLKRSLERARGDESESETMPARIWDHLVERWWNPSTVPPSPWNDLSGDDVTSR